MRTRRVFIAATPPPQIAAAMLAALPAPLPATFRPLLPDQIHLTLQFIGNAGDTHLDALIESMVQALSGLGPQSITPERLATFPSRPPSRLVAVIASCSPQLREAHKRLALRLARVSPRSSTDQFEPHFTLARSSPPHATYAIDAPCTVPAFELTSVCLFESSLSPAGSRYRILHEHPLLR